MAFVLMRLFEKADAYIYYKLTNEISALQG